MFYISANRNDFNFLIFYFCLLRVCVCMWILWIQILNKICYASQFPNSSTLVFSCCHKNLRYFFSFGCSFQNSTHSGTQMDRIECNKKMIFADANTVFPLLVIDCVSLSISCTWYFSSDLELLTSLCFIPRLYLLL